MARRIALSLPARRARTEILLVGTFASFALSILIIAFATWWTESFGARIDALKGKEEGFTGADLSFRLAHLLTIIGLPPCWALIFVNGSAFCALVGVQLFGRKLAKGQTNGYGSSAAFHPLFLACCFAGVGFAAVGVSILFRTLAELPRLQVRDGMPLVGLAIAFCWLAVPGFSAWLLPLAAILPAFAPGHMFKGHMRVYYLFCFTPIAMVLAGEWYLTQLVPKITGATALAAALPVPVPAPLTGESLIGYIFLAIGLAVATWPPVLPRRIPPPAWAAPFGLLCLAALTPNLSIPVLLAAGAAAQLALSRETKARAALALSHVSGLALLIALEMV